MKTAFSFVADFLAGIALLWAVQSSADQFSSVPREDFWQPGPGIINAVAQANGVIYVGGSFQSVLRSQPSGVGAYDLNSGTRDPDFPLVAGTAFAVLPDNEGGWFIGGDFSAIGGVSVKNLAHVRADKTVDPNWAPNPDGRPVCLALSGNVLYVGGWYCTIGSQPRSGIAAIDITSGRPTAWDPNPQGAWVPNATVVGLNSIVVCGQTVYVGGVFSSIGGQARRHLAALDAITANATDWNPNPNLVGYSGSVGGIAKIAVSANCIYVVGGFTEMAGQPRNFVAAFDEATGQLRSWDPNPSSDPGPSSDPVYVSGLAVCCDKVYVSGSFDKIGGQSRHDLAALDAVTGQATSWDPSTASGYSRYKGSYIDNSALALDGNVLYVAGSIPATPFWVIELLGLDANTGEFKSWRVTPSGPVTSVAVQGSTLIAGENWRGLASPQAETRSRPLLAAFDAATGQPLDWGPAHRPGQIGAGSVDGLAVTSDAVGLVGTIGIGDPDTRTVRMVDGLGASGLEDGALLPWCLGPAQPPEAVPSESSVVFGAMAADEASIYVSGRHSGPGNNPDSIFSLSAQTGATNWATRTDLGVSRLAAAGDRLYALGTFTTVGGLARTGLAALNAATGAVIDWTPEAVSGASLVVANGTVYVGGADVVAIDATTGQCTRLNLSPDKEIQAATAFANVLYLAGEFTTIAGQNRSRFAAVDLSTGQLTDWNPGADKAATMGPFALSASEQALAVVGDFASIGGKNRSRFAVFPRSESPQLLNQPENQRITVGQAARLSVQAIGAEPKQYQWSRNGAAIPGATQPTLVLSDAKLADAGEYAVQVSSSAGAVQSRRALVTVVDSVRITVPPVSQSVPPSTTVVFQVVATGSQPLRYQWRLNGVDLPAQSSPILTLNPVEPSDAGLYSVVASNAGGSVSSEAAELRVLIPSLPLTDRYADRGTVVGVSGTGVGNNSGASLEPNEPRSAKSGGKSLWLAWRAPGDGLVVYDTRGSAFDTLLAVYTGNNLGALTPVSWDDDSGGFLTSRVVFSAFQGAEYQIVVDGLNGAAGNLVLNWSLVGAPDAVPRIVVAPRSQVVGSGVEVTIGVLAASLTPLQYQWRFNCSTLLGQTNDTLHIRQVGRQQVGIYSVQVSNAARVIESEPATLQVNLTQGAITEVLACDKLVDATAPSSGLVLRARARNGSSLRPQVVSLSKGVTGLQIFNTYGATKEPGEPNHCGVAGGASYWFALRTESDGLLTVSTEGSDFDTVLAVYTLGGTRVDSLILMACDDNSGLDGLTSLTCFGAKAGTVYHIAVDGVNGTTGTVRLSYALDEPATALPLIPTQTSFRAQFGGAAGRSYRVQASGDLVRWHSLFTTNLTSANLFQFIDPNMLRLTYRFYRALPVP